MPGLIAAFDTTDAALADTWADRVAFGRGLFVHGLPCFLAYGADGLRAVGALFMCCDPARPDKAAAIDGLSG